MAALERVLGHGVVRVQGLLVGQAQAQVFELLLGIAPHAVDDHRHCGHQRGLVKKLVIIRSRKTMETPGSEEASSWITEDQVQVGNLVGKEPERRE